MHENSTQATQVHREIDEFRREVRAWIAANRPAAPAFKLPQSFLEVESEQQFEFLRTWQYKLYAAGYLGLDWPQTYGGQGANPPRQFIVDQELIHSGAPFLVNTIGLGWAGPTILQYGSEEQKLRYLKPLLSAEEIWCQGFSEPGAGSDLASLSTHAEKTNEGYCVNGHKVWTTLAHYAHFMILLARTGTAAEKHAGLSYFLFPMRAPGVRIEPLVKLTGEGGFNQVICEAVRMPRDALLGHEGQGWEIALATLRFERGAEEGAGGSAIGNADLSAKNLAVLARRTRRDGTRPADDPVLSDRLAALWIRQEALRLGALRRRVPELVAERPLALALMQKLVSSELGQAMAALAVEMLGPEALLWLGDPQAPDGAAWPRAYLNSFGMTIGGGTSEIQRNILGERVLGLPKSR